MAKTFWLFLKLLLGAALVYYLLQQGGMSRIVWQDTTIDIHTGFVLALSVFALYLLYQIMRGVEWLFSFPERLHKKSNEKKQEKGRQALLRGFTAIAAHDQKQARRQARAALKLLGEDDLMTLFLTAMEARLSGDHARAKDLYSILASHPDTAALGLRGLIVTARHIGDKISISDAEKLLPASKTKDSGTQKVLYQLALNDAQWIIALDLLKALHKKDAVANSQYRKDKAALLSAQAMENVDKQARKKLAKAALAIDPAFTPAAILALNTYIENRNYTYAKQLFSKCWQACPHPDLIPIWDQLMPEKYRGKGDKMMHWYETLLEGTKDSVCAHRAIAEKALELKFYGTARTHLRQAEAIRPSKGLYMLYATLEEDELGNEAAAKSWTQKAANAAEDKDWVCQETGRRYKYWAPLAKPHNSFNTIIWAYPDDIHGHNNQNKIGDDLIFLGA